MKRGIIIIVVFLLVSFVYAQEGPKFSEQDLDNLIAKQQKSYDIAKKCEVTSFVPPDPDKRVTRIDIRGTVDGKCKIILTTDKGIAEYLLSRDVYTKIDSLDDLFKGDCTGACEYSKSVHSAPEPENKEEKCMQKCIVEDCDRSTFECEKLNRDKCEMKCGMIKDPEASNENEQCIRDCVGPNIMCNAGGPDAGGETNPKCKECAEYCLELYGSGNNCLTEEEWEDKEESCKTCEHCYGEAVYGPSGDGYGCIVDVKCFDATEEWGDDSGEGPASYEPGHEPSEDNVYWWDYETSLSIEDGSITISDGKEEKEVEFEIEEGLEVKKEDDKIKIKDKEHEIIIDENSEELLERYYDIDDDLEEIRLRLEEGTPVYELTVKERAKLFGFINIKKEIKKKIDASNLKLIEEEKPWWSLFALDYKEDIEKVEDSLCTDSDKGKDFSKKGYVYKKAKKEGATMDVEVVITEDHKYKDKCLDGKNVLEFYCEGNEEKSIKHECEEVCFQGKCETIDISDIEIEEVSFDYVVISWKTNIPTTSKILYQESDGETLELNSLIEVEDHSVTLFANIYPDTQYSYRIVSCIKDVYCEQSEIMKFKTEAKGCKIDDKFYPDGQEHPNGCQVCDGDSKIWRNCDFKGTLYLTDLLEYPRDIIFEYNGFQTSGESPNVKVWPFPDDLVTHKCYQEDETTNIILVKVPENETTPAQGIVQWIWFICENGELSRWNIKGLPPPPPPELELSDLPVSAEKYE